MEDGGIAHRLEGQLRFHVSSLAKMLVFVIKMTISAGVLGVGIPFIETDAEEDAVLLVGCFHCHE